MCGRVASRHSVAALQQVLGVAIVTGGGSYRPGYNIGPGRHIPVIRKTSSKGKGSAPEGEPASAEKLLHIMKWGLIPSYTKLPKDGKLRTQFNMINARSEGLTKSAVFRRLLKNQRCVAVLDGFYEWEKLQGGKKKQPYYIHTGERPKVTKGELKTDGVSAEKNDNLLHLAALYDVWRGESGEEVYSVTILTTAATKEFSRIHDRMPVILSTPERVNKWLDCACVPFEKCIPLLSPFKENKLSWYKVSDYVGSIRNQKGECMEPLEVVMKRRREKGIGRFFKPLPKADETSADRKDPKPETLDPKPEKEGAEQPTAGQKRKFEESATHGIDDKGQVRDTTTPKKKSTGENEKCK
mmetsp:Transcript_24219/g.58483  ORF Transcript_24219/g.58483 Transcript_24219/m.58483 type:complete len:354 (-) Transcript_24219:289-1350(-)|eukprot:CAMPEP_0114511224 /NCGR_PEP_ID=MMETSP0109-20121206/14233_1 /TAXON_ID=29199 /ORGANISM="Chlorarachnion reptans, Strain CCCM449" /LENGTH=353 /DNA_ID=CAMNT_0001690637 /DNA_START=94 /DNA_END=1155 /DNA_ORIENTATION=+